MFSYFLFQYYRIRCPIIRTSNAIHQGAVHHTGDTAGIGNDMFGEMIDDIREKRPAARSHIPAFPSPFSQKLNLDKSVLEMFGVRYIKKKDNVGAIVRLEKIPKKVKNTGCRWQGGGQESQEGQTHSTAEEGCPEAHGDPGREPRVVKSKAAKVVEVTSKIR